MQKCIKRILYYQVNYFMIRNNIDQVQHFNANKLSPFLAARKVNVLSWPLLQTHIFQHWIRYHVQKSISLIEGNWGEFHTKFACAQRSLALARSNVHVLNVKSA